jgi:hypothetical protein
MNHKIAFLSAAFLFIGTGAIAAEKTADEIAAEQIAAYKPATDKTFSSQAVKTNSGIQIQSWNAFTFAFATWEPDHLHWNEPSNFIIRSDGTWYLYAAHLANMRRTGGIFDTGNRMSALINVTYYDGWDAASSKCTGTVIHSSDYSLRSLDYKDEVFNADASGTDTTFAGVVGSARCASVTRWWR